jgi:hypothetical protein
MPNFMHPASVLITDAKSWINITSMYGTPFLHHDKAQKESISECS